MDHVHAGAGILSETMHYADLAYLQSYTSVVEGLSTLERDLTELEPKALESRVALQLTVRNHSHKRTLAMRRRSHPKSRTSGRYKTNANFM
jgi:hypothetical protein